MSYFFKANHGPRHIRDLVLISRFPLLITIKHSIGEDQGEDEMKMYNFLCLIKVLIEVTVHLYLTFSQTLRLPSMIMKLQPERNNQSIINEVNYAPFPNHCGSCTYRFKVSFVSA